MRYTHLVETDRSWVNDLYTIDAKFEENKPPEGKGVLPIVKVKTPEKPPENGHHLVTTPPENGPQLVRTPSATSSDFANLLKSNGFSGLEKIGVRGREEQGAQLSRFIVKKLIFAFAWSIHGISNTIKIERFVHEDPRRIS